MTLNFKNAEYENILNKLNTLSDVNHDNICAICRDNILLDTITLSCNHKFHSECLLNSFQKYCPKKCPFCNEGIIIDSYKTTCCQVQKNKSVCNKICYNDEKLCKRHINIILKNIEKEQTKERNKILKKLKQKEDKLKKMSILMSVLENEIKCLKLQLN